MNVLEQLYSSSIYAVCEEILPLLSSITVMIFFLVMLMCYYSGYYPSFSVCFDKHSGRHVCWCGQEAHADGVGCKFGLLTLQAAHECLCVCACVHDKGREVLEVCPSFLKLICTCTHIHTQIYMKSLKTTSQKDSATAVQFC